MILGQLRDGPGGLGVYGFRGQYHFLSNFFEIDILIPDDDGTPVYYKSSEHYFMSCKPDPHSRSYAMHRKKIMEAKTPALAKKYAWQNVLVRPNWYDFHRIPSMEKALRHKFAIPEMWYMLDETGDLYLEETNTWEDTFWGVYNGVGKNMLGKLLMKVRSEYRNEKCSLVNVGGREGQGYRSGADHHNSSVLTRDRLGSSCLGNQTKNDSARRFASTANVEANGLDFFS